MIMTYPTRRFVEIPLICAIFFTGCGVDGDGGASVVGNPRDPLPDVAPQVHTHTWKDKKASVYIMDYGKDIVARWYIYNVLAYQ
jgi:hypothetical protein